MSDELLRVQWAELLDFAARDDETRDRLRAIVERAPETPDGEARLLTVADVVERSRLSESTVRRAVTAGELRSTKLGARRLVSLGDFERWAGTDATGPRPARLSRPSRRGGASFSSLVRSRRR